MMSSEFDKVFTELEAPDYPATCDQCGVEGTNASMDEHVCDESPVSRAGEQNTAWTLEHLSTNARGTKTLFHGSTPVAIVGTESLNDHQRALDMTAILNQHATLIEQRERLLRLLRPVTSPTACYCAVMKDEKCWHCEARELIATIEPETEVK